MSFLKTDRSDSPKGQQWAGPSDSLVPTWSGPIAARPGWISLSLRLFRHRRGPPHS